jgi:ribosomal 50S subunit-associated protein YjgA (DUF615 family)
MAKASNVSLEFIGAQLERVLNDMGLIRSEIGSFRDDMRVQTAILMRLENSQTAMLEQLRAMVDQHARFDGRLRKLEDAK